MNMQLTKINQIIMVLGLSLLMLLTGCGGGSDTIGYPQVPANNNSGIISIPSTDVQLTPVPTETSSDIDALQTITPSTEEIAVNTVQTQDDTAEYEYSDPSKPLIEDNSLTASVNGGSSLSSAVSVSIPYNTTGSINKAGIPGYYKFNISGNSNVTATLNFTHSRGDIDMELLNSSGTRTAISNGSSNTEKITKNLSSGTYYVKVYGYNRALNSYSLSITGSSTAKTIYTCQIVSQYGHPAVEIGKIVVLQIKIKNTGNTIWYWNKVRLGTWNSQDRNCGFYFNGARGWLSPNRIRMVENSVNPGQTATFEAEFKAVPSTTIKGGTCHKEYFRLVVDNEPGQGRFGPEGIFWAITVYDSNPIQVTTDGREFFGDTGNGYYQRYYFNMTGGKKYTVTLNPLNNCNTDLYTHNNRNVNKGYYIGKSTNGAGQADNVTFTAPYTGQNYIAVYGVGDYKNSFKLQVRDNSAGSGTVLADLISISPPRTWSTIPAVQQQGGKEQCAEYVQRIFSEHGNNTIYGDFNVDRAAYWFGQNPSGYTKISNGSGQSIQTGDIICWSGLTWGHVAIINKVTSNSIEVIEANYPTGANNGSTLLKRTISYNSSTKIVSNAGDGLTVQGWFHPEGSKSLLYR